MDAKRYAHRECSYLADQNIINGSLPHLITPPHPPFMNAVMSGRFSLRRRTLHLSDDMESWLGNKKRILVLNREDMISTEDQNAWATYYAMQGIIVVFSNGQLGMGSMKLCRLAKALASGVNIKGRAKGLLPLQWVHFGKDLESLDSPGIIPKRINDQSAVIKLAIFDDIGERSYDVADVAAILVQMLTRLPGVGPKALYNHYKICIEGLSGNMFVHELAVQLFNDDTHQAAFCILTDFQDGKFGWIALERPPR